MSDDPLERMQAIAGEHYENYVIIVLHPLTHEVQYVHDNVYAATGLLTAVSPEIKNIKLEDTEDIDWEQSWSDEIEDEDNEF